MRGLGQSREMRIEPRLSQRLVDCRCSQTLGNICLVRKFQALGTRGGDITLTGQQGLAGYGGKMIQPVVCYKRHRFPPQIIARAVWLYFRFPLSLRLVEEMLLERGIVVSYETIRRWAMKFGPDYVRQFKRKTPSRHDIWHLDEVVITICGEKRWLWRAVDQDGYVLDEIVQARRNTAAAQRLLTRLIRKQGLAPKRIVTDKLGSYAAAKRAIMPNVEHRSHKGLNNQAENSHVPLRKRERAMQGFRSWSGLQRFVSIFSAVRNLFVPPRSQRSASAIYFHRLKAMTEWRSAASIHA
jgi:putative transposase